MAKFQKGQSGNPLGRPRKIVEDAAHSILLEVFNAEAERACVAAMVQAVVTDRSVAAFNSLMDRKYGKVTEKTESHLSIDVTRLSDEELERLVKGG